MAIFNRYNIEARYIPSLVCSVPFFFLGYYFLVGIDSQFWNSATGMTISGIGLTTAMLVIMANFCRNLGKMIEKIIFKDGLSFPTTTLLLNHDKNLSTDYKLKIIKKIKNDFEIDLMNRTGGSVLDRQVINETVRRINRKFYGKSIFLLQRTIQFGFAKNLFAGSTMAIITSAAGLIVSYSIHNIVALNIAVTLLLIYLIISLMSFFSIKFTANHYAIALYDEFLAN